MPFAPIKRLKVAEQVAASIRDAIVGGELEAGESLPSERDLATRFGVNRASVREAMHRLEAQGFVEIRQGGATRVRDLLASAGLQVLPFLLAPGGKLDPALLTDILEIRTHLLGWTAGLAASRATLAEVQDLQECLDALEGAPTPRDLQDRDFDFFELLVATSDNRVLGLIANAVRSVWAEHRDLFAAVYAAGFDTTHHRAAVKAIADGDSAAATAAMEAYGRMVPLAPREVTHGR